MKHRKEKYQSHNFIAIFFVLVLAAGVTILGLSFFVPTKLKDDNEFFEKNISSKTEKQSNGGSSDVGRGGDDDENPDKTPKQNEDNQNKSKDKIDFSVTKSEVIDGIFMLRITIYEEVSESGVCTLEMKTKNDDFIKRTAKVIEAGSNTYSCEGFDIQTKGISSGDYTYTITVESEGKKGGFTGSVKI